VTRILTDDDLASLGISPRDVADAIEVALGQQASGRLHVTPKAAILPGAGRYMMSTLAVGPELTVVKQVTVSSDNPARGLPAINGGIMVCDAETGLLRAVLEANWLTGIRTAALSAVAARRLANPQARVLTLIGAGVQGSSHLAAFAAEYPLTEVRVLGRGQANIDRLIAEARALGLEASQAADAEAALIGADIVVSSVTLNYDTKAFLDASLMKPGAFAAVTDLMIPWFSAEPFATIVVDDLEQETAAERPMVPAGRIATDLAGLVASGPRFDPAKRSAFAFRGIALGDYAATALALSRAG